MEQPIHGEGNSDHQVDPAYDDLPDPVARLINLERRLLVPSRPDERPHSQFLKYHREKVFKG